MSDIPCWEGASGRRWMTVITVDKIRLAREIAGVNLLKALDGDLFVEMEDDPIALSAVLWSISKRQADYANVSVEEFERDFRSESLEQAAASLIEALILFCPPVTDDDEKKKDAESKQSVEPLSDRAWKIIHEMAGIVEIDPGPFTWRELVWETKAKRRHDWSQTSLILTINANANRDEKKRKKPFHPNDFMPDDLKESIRRMGGFRLTPQNLHVLKPYFSQPSQS